MATACFLLFSNLLYAKVTYRQVIRLEWTKSEADRPIHLFIYLFTYFIKNNINVLIVL